MKRLTIFLSTPAGAAIALWLIILVSAFVITQPGGLPDPFFIHKESPGLWDFVDLLMLTALVSPAIYFLIFRPMYKQQLEKQHLNEQLEALIEAIPDAIFLKDGNGCWRVTNEPARRLFRLHGIPWLGKTEMELGNLQPELRSAYEGCLASDEIAWQAGHLVIAEESVVDETGQSVVIESRKVPVFSKAGKRKGLAIIGRDVTERKAAEARIERLTKLYRALSEVSLSIVRMDQESELFPLVCRMAVEFGGVGMAWIGKLNEANSLIEPAASYGRVAYLDDIVISSQEDVPEGRGPAGTAFRESRNVVVNDFPTNETTRPWRERTLRYDWGSGGFFPIFRAGAPFALLSVYHSSTGAFDAEMIELLEQLSRNTSFALDSFDRENDRRQTREALIDSESRFRAYFKRAAVGMAVTSPEKGWLDVNDALCEMLGYSHKELMHLTWAELTHPDDLEENLKQHERLIKGEVEGFTIENRFICKDGQVVYARRTPRAVRKIDGSIDYIIALIQDITERKRAEQELRIAATAFETQEGIVIADRDQRILRVNSAFTRLTGYSAEEVIGKTPALLSSGRQDRAFYRSMWQTIQRDKYWQGEIWNRRKDGVVYPEWLTITAVTDTDGEVTHYIGVFTDITLRKAADEQIHQLAFYDPLTHLPNRSLLRDRLQQALKHSAHHKNHGAILFIDLDNFKILNDTRGHDIGDQLLVAVGKRFGACVRSGDTIARLGGDEFVVMLDDLSEDAQYAATAAQEVGGKILASINRPFHLHGFEYHCSASIGICLFCDEGMSMDDLLKHADTAMYQAKSSGRNVYRFFDPAMQHELEMRVSLETSMRHGLRNNEFRLHYQPQVDSSGRTTGAEALVRWQHPERGLVSPMAFIPLAEETGLIMPLGLWVLETACAQLAAWAGRVDTAHLTLSVNVSARQFRHADFVDQVLAVLDATGANPQNLKLELTESLLVDDVESTIVKMSALKAKGVRFSLDDFGTGYSSLAYLKRLPLDQLKIDQSFVRDILTNPNDAALARTIIVLAQQLDLSVIAEGVETVEQRDFLVGHGCLAYQGYLFGKPVPIESFDSLHAFENLLCSSE